MKTHVYKSLAAHLKKHLKPGMHLALALSGGPDSMALYHLLLEAKDHFDFSLSLLHVDHGWREESEKEAEELAKLPFPFYQTRLEMSGGNLEEKAREARYAFFEKMQEDIGFDALLLAHQRDDLAETALKRVCEGAALENQACMRPVSCLGGLALWRPLLSCAKSELISYLAHREYFTDPTNASEKFLRGRMREKIVPKLERDFGKNVRENLAWHAEKSAELADFLERKLEHYFAHYRDGTLNLEGLQPVDPYELKIFLRKICPGISAKAVDDFVKIVMERSSGKKVVFPGGEILYDRGRVETNFFEPATLGSNQE